MPEMELAIVIETKATIAKARMTTTTGTPFKDSLKKGRLASKTKLCVFSKITLETRIFRRQKRTGVTYKAHFSSNSTAFKSAPSDRPSTSHPWAALKSKVGP